MDVRASLNTEGNLSVVTGEGEKSFIDNDSFFAKAPPQAASTVGRTKSRRFMQDSEMGSFLDDMPGGSISPFEMLPMNGARPKIPNHAPGHHPMERNGTDLPGQNIDWSVVNDWCRDNKSDVDKSSQDDRSSMGILNIDEMDLSSNLMLEAPLHTEQESASGGSLIQKTNKSENSTLKNNNTSDSFPWRQDGSSSNSSQDTKQDQPFARSQITTVKKPADKPKSMDPVASAIRQSLFGQMTIGEEGEEKDTSIYQVELQAEELNEIDNDFGEIDLTDDSEGEDSKTPVNKVLPKMTVSGDEIRIDSIYLRPGVNGEEQQTSSSLPFLSKVSLFEGGSGSEIDTEDELEQVRKEQGARHEAAGEASYQDSSRPGLEGDCSDDHSGENRLPITQRQSAEGDVVSSPVPGDGGGGGDGSSGSESDDGRRSQAISSGRGSAGYANSLPANRPFSSLEQEEQRIRPMGDDLLSEMRFSKYEASTNQESDDSRLHSRYLARVSLVEDTNTDVVLLDDFFGSQHQTGEEEEFNPGNRLEASGFNADDFSTQNQDLHQNSNPFGQFESSFGSFGLGPSPGPALEGEGQPHFDAGQQVNRMSSEMVPNIRLNYSEEKEPRSSADHSWTQLVGSASSSVSSKPNSLGSEPRTSRDVGLSNMYLEQTDYARMGSEERGSLGRSSGSGSPSRSFTNQGMAGQSNGSSLSHSGSDSNLKTAGSKPELKDSGIFKKPYLPPPKSVAVFTKSVAKSKSSQSGSYHSNSGKASGQSSLGMSEFKNDLAYRLSLTNEAEEQCVGLRRVPSVGETSTMDLTVNDGDFFGNADALAMLDQDEQDFEEENIFRQDDAMADTGSSGEGWAYKSIMSMARPSWLDDPSDAEKVIVRISVGSYMRGRTEALGSLDGDKNAPRPDFGMTINSPNKENETPARLVEEDDVFEEKRTSGVGEHQNGSKNEPVTPKLSHGKNPRFPQRTVSEDVADDTMTMESLLKTPKADCIPADTTSADDQERSMATNDTSLSAEMSRFLKQSIDFKAMSTKYLASHSNIPSLDTVRQKMPQNVPASPLKSSHLPVKKGSNISQSFQVGSQSHNSVSGKESKQNGDVPGTSDSYSRQRREFIRNESPDSTRSSVSPKPSARGSVPDDVWSSPNTSNYCVPGNGLFDRMDDFQFSERFQSSDKINISKQQLKDLKDSLKAQYSLSSQTLNKDREKTPPPDGEDRRNPSSRLPGSQVNLSSQFNKTDLSNTKTGLHVRNKSGARDPKDLERKLQGNDQGMPMLQKGLDKSRLNTSAIDHGYMPGHHIPDGTAYSQRSDYSHMDHKGMSREDVAGVDDVGLAESRGFDMLRGRGDITRQSATGEGRSTNGPKKQSMSSNMDCLPVYMQPVQSISPAVRNVNSHASLTIQTEPNVMPHNTNIDETRAPNSTDRLESWTQTSLLFKEGESAQPENQPNRESIMSTDTQGDALFHTIANESFNMTDNMKSQQNFNQNVNSSETQTLHFLTQKTSLLKTQFAQENLKRDYGVEVMDKIYSNNSVADYPSNTVPQRMDYRLSMDSTADWTHLQGQQTMDASQMTFGDITNMDHHRLGHVLPSASSTPGPGEKFLNPLQLSRTAQITMGDNQTQYSRGYFSKTDNNPFETPGRVQLCPVESPGVLRFKDACCVGISKKEILPLKNPTDRWMECIIQVTSLEIDGQTGSMDFFPFELRQKKIIINPYRVENVDVMFLPKKAGAYVAQLQIFSQVFTKSDERRKESIPVNVTFQAIAEDPWIKVHCEDSESDILNFGEMVWGSCKEKTICLKNMGYATVPLRLAITSTKGWHCFSFEPEGRMSDVSLISGIQMPHSSQGKTIINISLSGCNESFRYHEVKVWCRPPDKQCSRLMARQPAEQFSCSIDVEVDIPSCKSPKLASMRMKALIGVRKLHIQSNLKEIQLSASPSTRTETSVRLFNAGNLNLNISLGFTDHKHVFSVTPTTLNISPGVDSEVKVSFNPIDGSTSRFMSLLLMMVCPSGPMYELCLQGDVIKEKPRVIPKFMCDCTDMDFGGVPIGKTVVKRYRLKNEGDEALSLTAESRVEDISLVLSPSKTSVGCKSIDLFVPPNGDTLPVYVQFSPTRPVNFTGKIVMRPPDVRTQFVVKVRGYGGVSKLCCSEDCTTPTSIQGHPCVSLEDFTTTTEICIRNIGSQTAHVKVALFNDLKCSQRLPGGQIVVQPSDFLIEAQDKKVLELVTKMSENEFANQCDSSGLGAVLRLCYEDQVQSAKRHKSDLLICIVKSVKPEYQFSSPYHTPRKSTRSLPNSSSCSTQPLKDTTSSRNVDNSSVPSSDVTAEYGPWNIEPQELVLYTSRKGSCDQMRMFNIFNNNNTDLSFEISWPGDMLSLIPGRGVVKPRETTYVQIFPSTKSSSLLDQLPWSGKVAVMANGVIKFLRVHISQDSSRDENEPVQEDTRLVHVSSNIPQPGTRSNKLGDLEVSRTQVMFLQTGVGKTSEETLYVKNCGPDMIRWMFSSFANPYLQKAADKSKEMFRVSYKVFDFTRQFGKLNGHESIELTVQFLPKSSGTFSQYWDLQTTGKPGSYNKAHRQDFIRIHFTGEGFEEPEPQSKVPSITKEILQSLPSDSKRFLVINGDKITFPATKPGSCSIQKTEFKNNYLEEVRTEVIPPKPPFYVKHQQFTIAKRRYLRFPVEFRPVHPGKFKDTVKFQSSKGESFILCLNGECQ